MLFEVKITEDFRLRAEAVNRRARRIAWQIIKGNITEPEVLEMLYRENSMLLSLFVWGHLDHFRELMRSAA